MFESRFSHFPQTDFVTGRGALELYFGSLKHKFCISSSCSGQPIFPPFSLPHPVGLFEVRAQEYLETLPSGEQSGVNKFLKGLGKRSKKPLLMRWVIMLIFTSAPLSVPNLGRACLCPDW